jgi:hypothetical protein
MTKFHHLPGAFLSVITRGSMPFLTLCPRGEGYGEASGTATGAP